MRHLTIAIVLAACAPDATEAPPLSQPLGSTVASLAGVDGTITTLATYDGVTPHPGVNAIDIGAPTGTPVFHQLDYLGPQIAGGWIYVEDAHEAGRCSQWWPGSPYYNGSKIYVYVYAYDSDGNWVGYHRAAFQHVAPYWENMNSWWSWNNANAEAPMFPEGATLTYGNAADGGLYLGSVFGVWGAISNGPGGGLCTTGSHLHQEGDGWRAGQRWVGEHVWARWSDLHYVTW
jgi:hypothetical protein